jgi:hypothetical protein
VAHEEGNLRSFAAILGNDVVRYLGLSVVSYLAKSQNFPPPRKTLQRFRNPF